MQCIGIQLETFGTIKTLETLSHVILETLEVYKINAGLQNYTWSLVVFLLHM